MGRTGDSLDDQLPPRSGGGSPRREDLLVGRKAGWPLDNMVVVVVVVVHGAGCWVGGVILGGGWLRGCWRP